VVGFINQFALDILEMVDLVSHGASLNLTSVNIMSELVTLGIKISTHVSLSDTFVT
jgi:hypothetical protein